MPYGAVTLNAGIDVETTPTDSEAGYQGSNMIRWKQGLAENIGGWVRYYPFSVGSIPRDLQPWQDLNGVLRLSVGATQSLSVIANGVNTVLTPQITVTDTLPDFSTTTGSAVITIVDSNILNPTTLDHVFIKTPVSVGGVVVAGMYAIDSVVNPTSYTIAAADLATGVVSHGGALPSFATTTSNPIVTVSLANHDYTVGESFYAAVPTSVGGITVSGNYLVQSVTTSSFTIIVNAPATSAATVSENNGFVEFQYYIAVGPQPTSAGYGTGTYGSGGYGTGIASPSGIGTPITATDWSQANWGEILLASPAGGAIYQWSPESGYQTMTIVPTAPIACAGIFVTMPQQILVVLGASFDGSPQPLEIAWSTAGDYANFSVTSLTLAGGYTIPRGSKIIGGLQASTQNLIFTDLAVWSMQFVGLPNVFGFNEIMSGCGLIGSHAVVLAEGTVFWMSQNQFFQMPGGGGPSQLPCKVWDVIFQDLDTANAYKIRAAANSSFNEISWHFPSLSGGTGENDSYVKYNTVEGEWDYGKLPTGRSAWVDQSVLGTPIGGDPTGLIFQHEQGYDGDGEALNPFFLTGYWVIGEGEDFAFIDEFLPDFIYGTYNAAQNAVPLITLYSVDYPNGAVRTYGPYSVGNTVNRITPRLRGRQMAMRVETQGNGMFFRLGKVRFRWAPDGRR